MKNKIIPIVISVLFALFLWYFMLPPLNPTSPTFWVYLFTVAIFTSISILLSTITQPVILRRINSSSLPRWFINTIGTGVIIIIVIVRLIK